MLSSRNVIFNTVYKVVSEKQYHRAAELSDTLTTHRTHLLKVLENDSLNANHRNAVLNSTKEAIQIPGIPQTVYLTSDFIQESIIISDMFKVNEITAVELIMSGEAESASNPDMTRGLIAILNYYHSQKSIVESLRLLLQAKYTITDESSMSVEVLNIIETFLKDLFNSGLFSRLVQLIQSMNLNNEINLLESQRALGSAKHRRQFGSVYEQIKRGLSECVMLRAYNTPLSLRDSNELISLIHETYRDDVRVKKEGVYEECGISRHVDRSLVYAIVGLMSSMNPLVEGNSVINYSRECFNHPFFIETNYKVGLDKILKDNYEKSTVVYENKSIVEHTDCLLYLSWVVSLQKMSHFKKEVNLNPQYQRSMSFGDYPEDFDDVVILDIDCQNLYESFQYLIRLINMDEFHEENIWVKCIHDLITDFIIYTPKMLKDLRTESMRLPSNSFYFGSLMELIGNLYGGQSKLCEALEPRLNPLLQTLAIEYWSPQEIINYSDSSTLLAFEDKFRNWNVNSADSYKQAVLFKFIRDSGDLVENANLFMSYVFMLKGLCCSDSISVYTYSFLNNNTTTQQTPRLTWEWFSNSLHNHAKFIMSTPLNLHAMSLSELNGLLVVLQLIKRVIQHSDVVCLSMANNESLMLVQNLIMLLSCRVPEILKAELLNCLAVFCSNALLAKSIWQTLETNNIITRSSDPSTCNSILIELDQVEPKSQQFPITRAFLNLLLAMLPHIVGDVAHLDRSIATFDQLSQVAVASSQPQFTTLDSFTNVVSVVMDTVFIKHGMRTYKNIEEKFAVCESFLRLCCKCVDMFLVQVGNIKVTKGKLSWCQYDPGFLIVTQLLNDSPFYKTVISIIDCGFSQMNDLLTKSVPRDTTEALEASIYHAMHLLWVVLDRESFLVQLVRELSFKTKNDTSRINMRSSRFRTVIPQELSVQLMSLSQTHHFFPNLIKYISMVDESEKISKKALSILRSCIGLVEPHQNLMLMLTNRNMTEVDLMPVFVTCLDRCGDIDPALVDVLETRGFSHLFLAAHSPASPRTLVLRSLLRCLEKPAPNLGHHLTGFSCDSIAALRRSSLQEAGVGDSRKTCLHSVLNLVQRLGAEIVASPCYDGADVPSDLLLALTVNMIDLTLALRILFVLASDPNTSLSVLRFTRSNYQLIFNQMDLLAFNTAKVAAVPELRALFWNQKSWLLKILAIELRQCSANQQRSYVSRLLRLLFGDDLFDQSSDTVFSRLYNEERPCSGLMYELLDDLALHEPEDVVDFSGTSSTGTSSRRFKPEVLREYLHQCLETGQRGEGDLRLMNGDRLRQLIATDLRLSVEEEAAAGGQMTPLHHEVDQICAAIDRYNTNEIWLSFGKVAMVEGWRQVLETVMVGSCELDHEVTVAVSAAPKARKVCATLRVLLDRIMVPGTPAQLVAPLSRTCLILAAVLGGLCVPASGEARGSGVVRLGEDDEAEAQLAVLVRLTTDCILKINCQQQNTRIRLYGVLTYLVQIVLHTDSPTLTTECHGLIASPHRSLYPTLCRDCAVTGNVHLSLSALTLLDCVTALDQGQGTLVAYLVSNGYLQHLISGLLRDCEHLAANMKQPEGADSTEVPFYLYQSKMAVLCRLASHAAGSKALVQHGLLTSLSQCAIFQQQQHRIRGHSDNGDQGPEEEQEEHQVLSLAVQLATSVLSSQGLDKAEPVREVLSFVGAFIEVLCAPFLVPSSVLSPAIGQQMVLTSSLFVMLASALHTQHSQHNQYQHIVLERIATSCSHMLLSLLAVINEPSAAALIGYRATMHFFLQIRLLGNLLSVASALVSPGAHDSPHNYLFFSNNVDGVSACRSNWNAALKPAHDRVVRGEKAPLSVAVMLLHKSEECCQEVMRLRSVFPASPTSDDLHRMSMEQLLSLWHSVCADLDTGNGTTLMLMDRASDEHDVRTKDEMVAHLMALHRGVEEASTVLGSALECCLHLLWHHLSVHQSAAVTADRDGAVDRHPLHRLQERALALAPSAPAPARSIIPVLASCVDEHFLAKLSRCVSTDDAFLRIVTHRLSRMLNIGSP